MIDIQKKKLCLKLFLSLPQPFKNSKLEKKETSEGYTSFLWKENFSFGHEIR